MDGDQITKRQRQKQRRAQRLAAEHAAYAKQRRLRLLSLAGVGLVIAGGIGAFVRNEAAQRAEVRQREIAAQARFDELGCTDVEEPEVASNTAHLDTTPAALAGMAPETIYPDRPATSGQMLPSEATAGIYSKAVDERLVMHNLEHGYIAFWYDEDADDATVKQLTTWARERLDNGYPKVIVAPFLGELPGDANISSTAWGARQLCEEFDADVAQLFLDDWHSGNGMAPEKSVGTMSAGDNPLNPEANQALLFPPLDSQPTEQPTEAKGSASEG